jgi:hypothetical protein
MLREELTSTQLMISSAGRIQIEAKEKYELALSVDL